MQNNTMSEARKRFQDEIKKEMAVLGQKEAELKEKEQEFALIEKKTSELRIAIPKLKNEIRTAKESMLRNQREDQLEQQKQAAELKKIGAHL